MADLESQLAAGDPAAFASERAELLALDAFPAGCVDPARGHEVLCLLDRLALAEEKDARVLGHLAACPACAAEVADARAALGELELSPEAASDPARPAIQVGLRCTYCHDGLARAEAAFCSACLAPHHSECWRTHGQCSALGCAETRWVVSSEPPRRARPALLIGVVLSAGAALAGVAALTRARGLARGGADAAPARAPSLAAEAAAPRGEPAWVLATRAERELAREAVDRGDLFSALERFETYRQASEGYGFAARAAAERARAEGLLRLGEPEQALESARRAEQLATSAEGQVILAEVAAALAHPEQLALAQRALRATEHAAVGGSWVARAHATLAEVYGAREELERAREHARLSEAIAPTPRAKLLRAQVALSPFYEGQHLREAERLIDEVLRAEPGSRWARALQVEETSQGHSRRSERPRLAAAKAAERHPRDPWLAALLARELQADEPSEARPPASPQALTRARSLLVDPRRPAGAAYAAGLRQELRAARGVGAERREGFAAARRLYRRALWLCPPHVPALAGLARLSEEREQLQSLSARALRQDPSSPLALALAARASRSPLRIGWAQEACGESQELALLSAEVEALAAPAGERIARAARLFASLRERWPDQAAVLEAELRTLRGIGAARLAGERFFWRDPGAPSPTPRAPASATGDDEGMIQIEPPSLELDSPEGPPADPAARERYLAAKAEWERELLAPTRARIEEVRRAGALLEGRLGRRAQQVAGLLAEESGGPLAAVERAARAARLLPDQAEPWTRLAQASRAAGDATGALVAALRAGLLEPLRAGDVLPYLSEGGALDLEQARAAAARQGPPDPRLERLLPWALAACARSPEGPAAAAGLEALSQQRPDALLAHTLLARIALLHERYDPAERHLAFVGEVLPGAGQPEPGEGEVHYERALAAAGAGADRRVIEALRRARSAGVSVTARALLQGDFTRLRRGPLWDWVKQP